MARRNNENLGKFIKKIREEMDLSQWEVAKALGLSSPQYISNVERGLSVLNPKLFRKIAKVLSRSTIHSKEAQKILHGMIDQRLKDDEIFLVQQVYSK